jgi:Arc/MetJ family transcription regulator
MSQIQADAMDPADKMAQSLRLLALRSLKAAVDNALNDKVRIPPCARGC